MRVSLQDLLNIFEDLIADRITRADASDWSMERRAAGDSGELKYSPSEDEPIIWEALLFLEGVDLKDGPDSYLHNRADFVTYVNQKLLGSD